MKAVILLSVLALAVAGRVSYEGHEVWRLDVEAHQVEGFRKVVDEFNLDVWGQGRDWADIMVNMKHSRIIKERLMRLGVSSKTMIPNVQELIDRDYAAIDGRQRSTGKADFTFDQYNTYDEIAGYLQAVAAEDEFATLNSLGQTIEGRDLWQLTYSTGAGRNKLWIDCGIHAREWITPATCVWGLNYLQSNYGVDPDVTALLDAYDLLIMPNNNPDGYEYTFTGDRMWRKNRNTYPDDLCIGIDVNRNFDDNFGGPGTSANSCSETYKGPSAASELETQATQAGIDAIASSTSVLFSIHSYSQLWMYPYGYTETELPPEAAELDRVSAVGVAALTAVNGTAYEYGPVATTIYPAAGTTIDYSYAQGIVYSFTLELRDKGRYGFQLPENQIIATAEETWAGIIAAVLAI